MQSPSLALLLAYLRLATPALLPILPSAVTNAVASANSSTPRLHHHSSSETFERIDYLVPHTTTFISVLLFPTYPLPAMEVEIVLSAIEQQLTTHIFLHGDGPLADEDDPYEFGLPGCYCSTSSASDDSLTYGVLRDTMRGLQHVVVEGRNFYKGFFDISERNVTGRKLGEGSLKMEGPEPIAHLL